MMPCEYSLDVSRAIALIRIIGRRAHADSVVSHDRIKEKRAPEMACDGVMRMVARRCNEIKLYVRMYR